MCNRPCFGHSNIGCNRTTQEHFSTIDRLTEISLLLFQPRLPKKYIHKGLRASKLSMFTCLLIVLYLFSRSYVIKLLLQVQQLKYSLALLWILFRGVSSPWCFSESSCARDKSQDLLRTRRKIQLGPNITYRPRLFPGRF